MIQDCQKTNILNLMNDVFPDDTFKSLPKVSRDRIFNPLNTLLTMVLTATQEDKSLKNSVALYYGIHQKIGYELQSEFDSEFSKYKKELKNTPKVGRPRQKAVSLAKSKGNDISLNTAAYSKARKRLSKELTEELFKKSKIKNVNNAYSHWHNRFVLIGDGTYVQMQDTPELRNEYAVKYNNDEEFKGYPQGLIVALIERGTGQISNFSFSNRHKSELALFYDLIDQLPGGCVLLLDELYNCYEILAKCLSKNIDVIVPSKRKRNYSVLKKISKSDEIIEISAPKSRSTWLKEPGKIPNKIKIRQIKCISPDGNEYKLHSTIIDEQINESEYQLQYLTRWDIEISIREVKTIMDINVLRSKTPEMVLKELDVTLATYNLIRKIIFESLEKMPFSPKEDFIQKFYTLNKNILVDKKGRVYSRWSTGRRRIKRIDKKRNSS